MTQRIRVVIVDDDVPTRIGLRTILSSAPDLEVVGEAISGGGAADEATRLQPDVVLMDIQLAAGDGIDATRRITSAAATSSVKVIVLTTFDFDEYAFQAMKAGASGFLLKRIPAEDLIASVRAVAHGDELPSPDATRQLIERFTRATNERRATVSHEPLTAREADVLRLIASGLSNAEISGALTVSVDTVKTHVKHIYAKCGVKDRAHAVIVAYETGFAPRTR